MLELTSHDAFEKCLVKNPIQLPSSTCVGDALQAMAKAHRFCELEGQQLAHLASNRSSCILVLEDSLLIGIVTERDLLQLVMQEEGWQALILDEVMSSPVITVELRKELTPLTISQSLQRHGIRHLPILTPTGEIHGVVTHRLLRHTIEAAHLLKLRFVSEVMVSSVVQAGEESSLLDIARLMYHNNIGSVVITRSHPELENEFMAVGLVTEQDILQCHALGLDLNQKPAIGSMSGSPQTIRMGDSLVLAKERMVQTRSDRLIVVGPSQEMVGLITQSNLNDDGQKSESDG